MPKISTGMRWLVLGAGVALLVMLLPRYARAQVPDPALLASLANHAEAFAAVVDRASYRLDEVTEELDRDGKVTTRETTRARVDPEGNKSRETVEASTRNGKDATAEKQEQVQDAAGRNDDGDANDLLSCDKLRMPFLRMEQPLYVFNVVGADSADRSRVEISFTPKRPDEHTMEGAAWVDARSGTLISAGAKLSKPAGHVDWVHFTVEFGARTPLGPALSHVTFEAKGGVLFVRKHVRGEMTLSDYRLGPTTQVSSSSR
jgi:hypothetical protein